MSQAFLWADVAALYRAHRQPIFGYVYHKLGKFGTTQEAIEDLTEEVFLRAIEAICAGHGPTSHVKGWLYRIAHNLVIDEYKRRSRRGATIDFDALAEVAQEGLTPHEQAMSAAGCERIWRCIERLSDQEAEVIKLTIEGHGAQDLAPLLRIGDSAAKGRLHRGRRRLAKLLSKAVTP